MNHTTKIRYQETIFLCAAELVCILCFILLKRISPERTSAIGTLVVLMLVVPLEIVSTLKRYTISDGEIRISLLGISYRRIKRSEIRQVGIVRWRRARTDIQITLQFALRYNPKRELDAFYHSTYSIRNFPNVIKIQDSPENRSLIHTFYGDFDYDESCEQNT